MHNQPYILVFGGTTEGKATANWLIDMGFSFYYSTKTPSSFQVPDDCKKVEGALSTGEMQAFCQANGIRMVIDAAHPYATELHQNIADCVSALSIPNIRVERAFMDQVDQPNVHYIQSLDAMIEWVKAHGYKKVASLMGVKSVNTLHQNLQACDVWYRILNQPTSWDLALSGGISHNRLLASSAFENLNDVKELIEREKIEVLLSKDSGYNGLFDQKVELANQYNLPLVVLSRPKLPKYSGIVKCRADLRSLMQDYFELPKPELAHGFTTGTCATICAKAAATFLLSAHCPLQEIIHLPDGEPCTMTIHSKGQEEQAAFVTVIKNSGDDPDLTDGLVIGCRIHLNQTGDIRFVSGEGVGTVRLPGLGLPIDEPAINKVPRAMIKGELELIRDEYALQQGFDVSVFIPQGKRLAEKTFNPRLGVEGGLSVIGSTGRIKPFSSEAYVATIQRQIGVVLQNEVTHVVMNSGGRSERYLKKHFHHLPDYSFVQYGNYIGEALKAASNTGLNQVSMGIMTGKAVKLAEGHLDTHSRKVVMNKSFITGMVKSCNYSSHLIDKVENITMARELETIFPFQAEEPFFKLLKEKCLKVAQEVVVGVSLEIILINNEGKMI